MANGKILLDVAALEDPKSVKYQGPALVEAERKMLMKWAPCCEKIEHDMGKQMNRRKIKSQE